MEDRLCKDWRVNFLRERQNGEIVRDERISFWECWWWASQWPRLPKSPNVSDSPIKWSVVRLKCVINKLKPFGYSISGLDSFFICLVKTGVEGKSNSVIYAFRCLRFGNKFKIVGIYLQGVNKFNSKHSNPKS